MTLAGEFENSRQGLDNFTSPGLTVSPGFVTYSSELHVGL
jgi:hypothetical protein